MDVRETDLDQLFIDWEGDKASTLRDAFAAGFKAGVHTTVVNDWNEDDLDQLINGDVDDDDDSVFSADNIVHDDNDHQGVLARLRVGRSVGVSNLKQLERDYREIKREIDRCAICQNDNND